MRVYLDVYNLFPRSVVRCRCINMPTANPFCTVKSSQCSLVLPDAQKKIKTMKYLSVFLLAVIGITSVTAFYGHHGMYRGYGSMYGMGYPRHAYGSIYGGYGGLGYGYGGYGGIAYGSLYGGYGYPYGGIGYGSMYGGLGYGGYRRFGGYGYRHGKYPRYISNKKYGYGY